MENIKYMVRVSCMTFNHAHYIADAMNGFCMQETNFPFVCTIIDDCSTDGEQDVIKNYLEAHFDLENSSVVRNEETEDFFLTFAQHKTNKNCYFAVLFLKYNHYSIRKPKKPYIEEWCDTKYVAICEGDDYWIDPLKLQKQVEYLEQHPETGLVHAKAKVFNQDKNCFNGTCGERDGGFEQIIVRNPIVTLTSCFRVGLLEKYKKESCNWDTSGWKMGDYPMWLWVAKNADIYFMDEVVAVYREQNNSITHSGGLESKLSFIDSTVEIQLFFASLFNQEELVKKQIQYNSFRQKALVCLHYNNKKEAIRYLKHLDFFDKLIILKRLFL